MVPRASFAMQRATYRAAPRPEHVVGLVNGRAEDAVADRSAWGMVTR
jgi:hypothetical protein